MMCCSILSVVCVYHVDATSRIIKHLLMYAMGNIAHSGNQNL